MSDENDKKPLEIEDGSQDTKEDGGTGAALGICFGCAFGLLVQIITGEVMWLPMGVAVGFGLAVAIGNTGR